YHNFHESAWVPNMNAWRVLAFPMTLFFLWHAKEWNAARLSLLTGALGTSAVLVNPETGVAASVGMVAYQFFRHPLYRRSWFKEVLTRLLWLVLGGAVVVAVISCLCWLFLGYFPHVLRWAELFSFLR